MSSFPYVSLRTTQASFPCRRLLPLDLDRRQAGTRKAGLPSDTYSSRGAGARGPRNRGAAASRTRGGPKAVTFGAPGDAEVGCLADLLLRRRR